MRIVPAVVDLHPIGSIVFYHVIVRMARRIGPVPGAVATVLRIRPRALQLEGYVRVMAIAE
ncbi:hypothetical protein X739_23040 [Mesorhizobium sp. LNHC220B00]|nr:hypothetical protein X739_23040 [Mesorhizobium sp. LNHC220B00]